MFCEPLLCPPKCAPDFGQSAFRDCHDLNNSIQESCLLNKEMLSCVLKHRDEAAMFIQIYISAKAASDAIITVKVGITLSRHTTLLCNLTFSVN